MAESVLVRHGQTELNVQNILQGWQDSPLTERGCEQALATRAAFEDRGVTFDHAYSSPLGRAQRTAELIVGEGRSIELVDDLREWHLARWRHINCEMPPQPWVIIRWPLVANLKASYGRAWLRRCPALWPDRSTIVCLRSLMALPVRSFLSMWPAGEDSPTTVPCFILAIATGRFRSLTGNERKDPYE